MRLQQLRWAGALGAADTYAVVAAVARMSQLTLLKSAGDREDDVLMALSARLPQMPQLQELHIDVTAPSRAAVDAFAKQVGWLQQLELLSLPVEDGTAGMYQCVASALRHAFGCRWRMICKYSRLVHFVRGWAGARRRGLDAVMCEIFCR